MKCVIPCAGRGTRMGADTPKALLEVNGRTILSHITEQWSSIVDDFVIVVGPKNEDAIRQSYGDAIFVAQEEPKGLANAILQADKHIARDEKFVVALGDCLYKGQFDESAFDLGIGVWETDDLTEINKNYQVLAWGGTVVQLIEKPALIGVGARNCGMGVYFMDGRVFDYIRKLKIAPGGGDFTYVLQMMIDSGEKITPVWFEGEYINVTYPEDLERAEGIFK